MPAAAAVPPGTVSPSSEKSDPAASDRNPQVYFDITADGEPLGRLVFELRKDVVPITVENFRCLCTHEKGFGYKGCWFYRIIPGFCCCSGDFETQNDDRTGGKSIYEKKYFNDENYQLPHDKCGILSMDNYGWPDTNSSRFFISFDTCPWMDQYHVAFGRIIRGMDVLKQIESFGTIEDHCAQDGRSLARIVIADCGELNSSQHYDVDDEEDFWGNSY